MHKHGTLQIITALITIIVIGIVSFILTKIAKPQPINDVGNFYDSIMNPEDTTPPNQDILEYKEGHLILHTEYLPAGITLRITLQDLKDRTFLQREYHNTKKPIILPTIAPPITHIILDITTSQTRQQKHYYLLQEHYTRETIRQASREILTLLQKDKNLANLFTTCTITTPTGRELTLTEIIKRSISSIAPLCAETYRYGGEASPQSRFINCLTADCTRFILTGVCPSDGSEREDERFALFIGNLQNILKGYGIDLLGLGMLRLTRVNADQLREEILRQADARTLEESPITCEAQLMEA